MSALTYRTMNPETGGYVYADAATPEEALLLLQEKLPAVLLRLEHLRVCENGVFVHLA